MPRSSRKPSIRERERALRRSHTARFNGHGDAPRIRWKGTNITEVEEFVGLHGGHLDVVQMRLTSGKIRLIPYVMPVGLVIHGGRWLLRVTSYPASDERGWRTLV